jgi:hypothetical protein
VSVRGGIRVKAFFTRMSDGEVENHDEPGVSIAFIAAVWQDEPQQKAAAANTAWLILTL